MGRSIPGRRLGLRMTETELQRLDGNADIQRAIHRSEGGGRYRTSKPVVDGHRFDSKHEAERYKQLKILQAAGDIRDLELQPRIQIVINGVEVKIRSDRYKNGRRLTYVGDFRYYDIRRGKVVIEDAKGHRNEVYKIKLALVEAMGLNVEEV